MSDHFPHMERARFLIHIGPPKTGTTTLQELVLPQCRRIIFLGKPWFNPRLPYDKCVNLHQAIDSISKAPSGRFDPLRVRRAVEDWLAHSPDFTAGEDNPLCLLSEERLCLTDVVPMQELADRLTQVFAPARMVMVRRDPAAAILSGYRWLYSRAWIHQGVTDWLREGMREGSTSTGWLVLQYYDWARMQRIWGAHFDLHEARMADMKSDPRRFVADFLGLPPDSPAVSEAAGLLAGTGGAAMNQSRNRAVAELHRAVKLSIRAWNRLPLRKLDEKPEYLGEGPLWDLLEAPLRRLKLGERKIALDDEDRRLIEEYYRSRGN